MDNSYRNSGVYITVDEDITPNVKEILQKVNAQIAEILQNGGNKNDVAILLKILLIKINKEIKKHKQQLLNIQRNG